MTSPAASLSGSASTSTGADVLRQVTVIAAFVFMIIGCFVGVGLWGGTPIQEAQGGSFQPSASYLTPATSAFGIWTPIYLGLLGYTIWQALPRQRESARQRAVGPLIAASMIFNGLWLVTVQFFSLSVTVAVVVLLLGTLAAAFVRTVRTREPRGGVVDSILIDGTTGLHLGWTTLATVANIGAALTATLGGEVGGGVATAIGIAVLVVVGIIGVGIAWSSRWRVTPGISIAWGLVWLAVARISGEPHSVGIGVAAVVIAAVVVLLPVAIAGLRLLRPQGD